jgi:3,4-dihydroxy 2-butanone 4-phosphate synthase/GTP cyclohydrolase II
MVLRPAKVRRATKILRALTLANRARECKAALLLYYFAPMTPKRTKSVRAARHGQKARIVARALLPTQYGRFSILGIEGGKPEESAVALVRGRVDGRSIPLVRIHSQCLTGDVLGSQRCDCRAQLELSLRKIAAAPAGILLYLPQEGRGIGLMNKLRAYELQDGGMDTVEANQHLGFAADSRDYGFSAEALRALGVRRVRLLSNNPDKVRQLESHGIKVVQRVACQPRGTDAARSYLLTKSVKLGHVLAGF